jgi:hypothetical protein
MLNPISRVYLGQSFGGWKSKIGSSFVWRLVRAIWLHHNMVNGLLEGTHAKIDRGHTVQDYRHVPPRPAPSVTFLWCTGAWLPTLAYLHVVSWAQMASELPLLPCEKHATI